MSKTTYHDPVKSVSGKLFGHRDNISQRKLFGVYDSTYCYQNKPDHWSDAQTLHRQKMGTASLYAKLLLQDPDFAAQVTAERLDRLRRIAQPHTNADKHLKPYLRNQQMLTSLLYNHISTDDPSFARLLDGYNRYHTCREFERSSVLAQLTQELAEYAADLKTALLQ